MNQMKMRSVLVLGVSVSLAMLGPAISGAAAAMASATPVAPTQTFVGGGTGYFGCEPRSSCGSGGHYTSTGQLGNGSYNFWYGPGPYGQFHRSDGTMLIGPIIHSNECEPVFVAAEDCLAFDPIGYVRTGPQSWAATADIVSAHIVLIEQNPSSTESAFLMRGTLILRRRAGYAMVDANGTTYAFGGIDHLGDAHTTRAMDIERSPSGSGYWIVNAMGNVYAFGDARYFGNANASALSPGEVVTSMSATPTAKGYWLFTSKGRAFTFGDAKTFGDLHALPLNGPIVGSVATPTGNGYYMVGSDGGVFAFGDAKFRGSMGNARLNRPVIGLVPTADNTGYWLVASDGGVFSFHAPFHGSMGAVALNRPIVTMVPYAGAYLMVASDGGVFNFSNGPFFGSEGGARVPAPIVNAASKG